MKDSKNDDGIALMGIWNHVGQTAEDQLPCSFNATWPSSAGMIHEHFDASNDLKHSIDRRRRVVTADIDRLKVLASGVRPL
jgi:hypothetical protein